MNKEAWISLCKKMWAAFMDDALENLIIAFSFFTFGWLFGTFW